MLRRDLLTPLIAAASSKYEFETEMLAIVARLGHRIESVPVSTVYGEEKSNIKPIQHVVHFFRMVRNARRAMRQP